MKLIFVILVTLISSFTGSLGSTVGRQSQWSSYKDKHGLTFANSQAEASSFATYAANLDYIDKWNSDPSNQFKLGENHLSHLSNDEMKKRVLMPPRNSQAQQSGAVHASLGSVQLSSLVNYTSYYGPIKNQGSCGSCYAFSVAGVIEGQYYMKTGKKISLSEEQILDCTSSPNGASQGCNGGDNLLSLAYTRQVGLCPEETYNYTAFYDYYEVNTGPCELSTIATCNPIKIKNYGQVTAGNENVLAAYIQRYGPTTVYLDASWRSFQMYKSGIYYEPKCSSVWTDHAVVAVGFGSYGPGQDFWILRNSWGTDWGMDGYMLLARNQGNNCAVASSPYFAKL